MPTNAEAQMDYINCWECNAKQHFLSMDYDWIASLIKELGVKNVFEIGCGVGYSTLALVNAGLKVISVDSIPYAIEITKKRLESFDVLVDINDDINGAPVVLKQIDVIENYEELGNSIKPTELVLICNPGGKLEDELTEKEIEMLRWGRYSFDEEENVLVMHKWAVLLAAARLAKDNDIMLIVVDRGTIKGIEDIFQVIEKASGLKKICDSSRQIKIEPENGVKLSHSDNKNILWGAGLFTPHR